MGKKDKIGIHVQLKAELLEPTNLSYLNYCNCNYSMSRVDEPNMKLVMSLPLNTAQGSRSAAPMGRG